MLTTNFYEFESKTSVTYLENGLFNMREEWGGRQASKKERGNQIKVMNYLYFHEICL